MTKTILYFVAHDRYVYALNRGTGALLWQTRLPRRSEVQPLLMDDVLYVAARDHNIYALDATTGQMQEAPILTTGGKITKSWAFDGRNLYFSDDLGKLYAIQLDVTGEEEQNDPVSLMQAGKVQEAAVIWALQGDYIRAAEIYEKEMERPECAAQLYEKGKDLLRAAAQYEAAGNRKQALELYRQAASWGKVASLSEEMGDLLSAAQAYEQMQDYAKAGGHYHTLQKYAQSIAMLEQAAVQERAAGNDAKANQYLDWAVKQYIEYLKQPAKAVILLNRFGRREEAQELLQSIPGWQEKPTLMEEFKNLFRTPQERALAYEKAGEFLRAAHEYAEAEDYVRSADLLARSGEFMLAADAYIKADKPAKAADMMVQMENWDEAAEMYLQAKRLPEAIQAFLKAGDLRHAAELFEQLGQWPQAAEKWEARGLWERAAQAWEKAQDFIKAARAWENEGEAMNAAGNYEKAARQISLTRPEDRETMARYYELAMVQYRSCSVMNKAEYCDKQRRYYRKQPLIIVSAINIGDIPQKDEWGKLDVLIKNGGWGDAREITIAISSQYFQLDTSRLAHTLGLGKGVETRYTLWLKPLESGTVPLHLTLSYRDRKGRPMPEVTSDTEIRVKSTDSKPSTPQVIHVQGDLIQAERVQKDMGDKVTINRNGGGIALSTSSGSASGVDQSGQQGVIPTIECAYCGTKQPATNPRCENPHCGIPFIQCPSCKLYQPYNERNPDTQFCIHCGQPL